MKDFVAIDFETANKEPSSVCSVETVIVRDGEIMDSCCSLIHPELDFSINLHPRYHAEGYGNTISAL